MRTAMFLAVAALWASDAPLRGEEPEGEDAPYRYYFVDAALFSFQPGQELSSYRSLGRGGAGGNSECGYGAGRFTVSVKCNSKAHRFLAKVEVKPGAGETRIQAQEHEYDLSDLRLRTLDIARDDDGRIYRLNLAPRIDETPKPSPFRVKDLRLENWSFPASPVVLNDQDYIGQLSMSSGALAWCDIPGVAKIEFSLLHLKDAQPWGQLKDGIIEITHKDGTSLRITNVLNGVHRQVLDGGPYQVWVRWMEPTQTVGQYRQSVKKMIAEISERAKSGDLSLPPGTLRRLERQRESDRIQQTSNGLRGVRPDEIVGPE
jgi:hypothetical protein